MEGTVRSAYMDIVERSALGKGRYRVTIAASESVRQQPDLDFDGLSTENYAKNPVVMWAHDLVGRSPSARLPIGRTSSLSKAPDGRIVAEVEFLSDDPFAQRVQNAWEKGFLQAASISWIPVETAPVDGGHWRDTRSELLEWSIVAVPADPDALREAYQRLMDEHFGLPADRVTGPVAGGLEEIGELVGAIGSALRDTDAPAPDPSSRTPQDDIGTNSRLSAGEEQHEEVRSL